MRIVTVAQAVELDQKAMQDHGIFGIDLMGAAGKAIAEEVKKMAAEIHDPRIAIVCGKGNNGGDGIICHHYLKNYGVNSQILLFIIICR